MTLTWWDGADSEIDRDAEVVDAEAEAEAGM